MGSYTPIETHYAGCRFRSRLEARWAVFLDHLDIKWDYEPQGFSIGPTTNRRRYLPDFWLPEHDLWAEVKGDATEEDVLTLYYAAHPAVGLPGPEEGHRILLLGNIPRVDHEWAARHRTLSYCAEPGEWTEPGVYTGSVTFTRHGLNELELHGIHVTPESLTNRAASIWHFEAFVSDNGLEGYDMIDRKTSAAYRAARSARFEHGEHG